MEITLVLSAIGIIAAIIIGGWQIHLARKQLQIQKKENMTTPSLAEKKVNTDTKVAIPKFIIQSEEGKKEKILPSIFHPLPSEIIDEIRKLPLSQQNTAEKSYKGLKVEWQVTLQSIDKGKKGKTYLMMLDKDIYPWVNGYINISKYPELKIAKEGQILFISGKIKNIKLGQIEINIENIKFTYL